MRLRNTIIYLIGVPAVGKYTIATRLGRVTGAKVVDNQLINTPIFSVLGYDGLDSFPFPREAWGRIERIQRAVLAVIRDSCPADDSFIFTNVLGEADPGDRAWYQRVAGVARARKAMFFPIHLTCDAPTLRRRKDTRARRKRLKDVDLASIPRWLEDFQLLKVDHPHAFSLDTTGITPRVAASRILEHIERVTDGTRAGRRPRRSETSGSEPSSDTRRARRPTGG